MSCLPQKRSTPLSEFRGNICAAVRRSAPRSIVEIYCPPSVLASQSAWGIPFPKKCPVCIKACPHRSQPQPVSIHAPGGPVQANSRYFQVILGDFCIAFAQLITRFYAEFTPEIYRILIVFGPILASFLRCIFAHFVLPRSGSYSLFDPCSIRQMAAPSVVLVQSRSKALTPLCA